MTAEEKAALKLKQEKEAVALKASLKKAVADIAQQKKDNESSLLTIKSLEDKIKAAPNAVDMEDIKNEISDLRGKIKAPVLAISDDAQKNAIKTMAVKAYNSFVRQAKGGSVGLKGYLGSIETEFKALNITDAAEGGAAVASVLSMDLIEYAREYSPILSEIGSKNGMTRDYTQLVLVSYPSIGDGIENVAGITLTATVEQTYSSVKCDVIKLYANPRLTDEALMGTDYDVYGDLIRLIGDEISITLGMKVLYGDGSGKNGRGILSSSRIDIADVTGKSFKPSVHASNARDSDYFPVMPTGVSGALGVDDEAIVDFFVDLTNTLPTKYLKNASFKMNRNTLKVIKKIRDDNKDPIYSTSFKIGGKPTIEGYPVTIDDTLPDITADSTPIIFGDLSRAFALSDGDVDYMQANPYKEQGVTILEYNKEVFTIVQASDAIIVVATTTNGPA